MHTETTPRNDPAGEGFRSAKADNSATIPGDWAERDALALHFGVSSGNMVLSQGYEGDSFGFDASEIERARRWLAGRSHPIALGSSSVDHPEEHGSTLEAVDGWLADVFRERKPAAVELCDSIASLASELRQRAINRDGRDLLHRVDTELDSLLQAIDEGDEWAMP